MDELQGHVVAIDDPSEPHELRAKMAMLFRFVSTAAASLNVRLKSQSSINLACFIFPMQPATSDEPLMEHRDAKE
ncbi:MAG: hypothetical protein O2856_12105 [Planctomycetota bacterium]|nr:hypothetical protein [Planctomycetota bacterium]